MGISVRRGSVLRKDPNLVSLKVSVAVIHLHGQTNTRNTGGSTYILVYALQYMGMLTVQVALTFCELSQFLYGMGCKYCTIRRDHISRQKKKKFVEYLDAAT